jgi:tRNA (cytidine/uridine-2'-O-)-methyltransferase
MTAPVSLALYQPDIPQNAGAILRLAACFGVAVHVIEPCGFVLDDRRLRRAGMDYVARATLRRHRSWGAFLAAPRDGRLLLATTAGETRYDRFTFRPGDCIILGRESAGAPPEVHAAAAARLRIPLRGGLRSINVAQAAAILTSEALRQLNALPGTDTEVH